MPDDAYAAIGGQGHIIVIISPENIVVVRRGHDGMAMGMRIDRFVADVVDALKQ